MDGRGMPKRGEGSITYLLNDLLYQMWERGDVLSKGDVGSKWKIKMKIN
jgi:hypothetical protein